MGVLSNLADKIQAGNQYSKQINYGNMFNDFVNVLNATTPAERNAALANFGNDIIGVVGELNPTYSSGNKWGRSPIALYGFFVPSKFF
jgi:hypothetical protein